jgi:hypothetical protein
MLHTNISVVLIPLFFCTGIGKTAHINNKGSRKQYTNVPGIL